MRRGEGGVQLLEMNSGFARPGECVPNQVGIGDSVSRNCPGDLTANSSCTVDGPRGADEVERSPLERAHIRPSGETISAQQGYPVRSGGDEPGPWVGRKIRR